MNQKLNIVNIASISSLIWINASNLPRNGFSTLPHILNFKNLRRIKKFYLSSYHQVFQMKWWLLRSCLIFTLILNNSENRFTLTHHDLVLTVESSQFQSSYNFLFSNFNYFNLDIIILLSLSIQPSYNHSGFWVISKISIYSTTKPRMIIRWLNR